MADVATGGKIYRRVVEIAQETMRANAVGFTVFSQDFIEHELFQSPDEVVDKSLAAHGTTIYAIVPVGYVARRRPTE